MLDPKTTVEQEEIYLTGTDTEQDAVSSKTSKKRTRTENDSNMEDDKSEEDVPIQVRRKGTLTRSQLKNQFIGAVDLHSFRVTVKKALEGPNQQAARKAIIDEVKNMLNNKVGHYIT